MNGSLKSSIILCSAGDCPIGTWWHREWRQLTFLTRDDPRFIRRVVTKGRLVVPAEWHVGPGDASNCGSPIALTTAQHVHCAFTVAGHVVHVDRIHATGSGPGFSLRSCLIHVNNRFAGRDWSFGCLGGNGLTAPAVARIVNHVGLRVLYGEDYTRLPVLVLCRIVP